MARRGGATDGAGARRTPPSRISRNRITAYLRAAGRKGDRTALTLALDHMRTLALSPRYWTQYLTLLQNPLARLVDLLVIKQGERIAQQKGWKRPGGRAKPRSSRAATAAAPAGSSRDAGRRPPRRDANDRAARPHRARPNPQQPTLFDF